MLLSQLLSTFKVMMERTAAVVANLTSMMDTFAPLRESGIVQKLVKLLEHGALQLQPLSGGNAM